MNDCPKCPLIIKHNYYLDEAKKAILKQLRRFPKGWSMEALLRLQGQISDLLAMNEDRINKRWNGRVIRLAEIVQSERQQFESVSNYDQLQRMKSQPTPSADGSIRLP